VTRFGVIDVGTNSVKFLLEEDGKTVVDRSEITRLGQGADDDGRLASESIARTVDAIEALVQEAGEARIAAVGTAGLRRAPNRDEVIQAVRERAGIEVEVITGEEEARLSYLATKSALGLEGSVAVFETGGGSTQFTYGRGDRIEEQFSVDVGAARVTERWRLDGAVGENAVAEALAGIEDELGRVHGGAEAVVGMGGAVTNLAAVRHGLAAYDPEVIQGTVLDTAEIDRQIELYRTRTADERRALAGLQPKRAEVILAGACIVRAVLAKLGSDSLTVSDRGLRHRLIVERFGERYARR
jgi:exopolyphosphatase / guanosine-5'-triphosphate,3'-diphosphate pyrophosphatase